MTDVPTNVTDAPSNVVSRRRRDPHADEHLRALTDDDFERSIAETARMRLPTKGQNLDDLGRMSGEAVLAQYDEAAKAVEEMGNAVRESANGLDGSMREADRDLKLIAEAAAAIREKGRRVQSQIEEASALSREVREACTEFKRKMGV
jgi:methyl-accepting chemotaxis protein